MQKLNWYRYDQNNSGGKFVHDPERGIGFTVWVEAPSKNLANAKAEDIGLYFNGCDSGRDCPCCGDRWSNYLFEEYEKPEVTDNYHWKDVLNYAHPWVGDFYEVK